MDANNNATPIASEISDSEDMDSGSSESSETDSTDILRSPSPKRGRIKAVKTRHKDHNRSRSSQSLADLEKMLERALDKSEHSKAGSESKL